MGGKSKKQQSTSTIGPPQYIQEAYQSLVGQAQNTAAQPFVPYTGETVAGLTPEQEAGIAGVTAAQGTATPYFGKAGGYIDQSAQSVAPTAFSSEALQQFLNPFQQQVIDATLANTAENDRRQQQDLTGKAIMSGAWGGDRAGVAKAELARQQKLAADSTLAGLNSQNFAQALQTFQQQQGVDISARQSDAARAAAAGNAMAGLGTTAQDSALKDAMAQIQAGGVRQQTQQAGLSSDYDQFLQEQAYPFMTQGWLANLLTGIGSSAGSTSTGFTKGSGDSGVGSIVGGALSLGSALFSDERVKEDIEPIGETNDGQTIYRFRYKGDPAMQIGLLAQEVEGVHPEAVSDAGGIKMVDYATATDDAARGVAGADMAFAEGGVVPYSGRVKSRIPDMQPIKGRTGLMAPPPAPGLPSDSQGGGSDMSKMGKQLGGLLNKGKEYFSTPSFDANTPRFDFQSGLQLYGPGFARGGVVDMEEDSTGMFRPAYEIGGGVAPLDDEYDLFGPAPIGGQDPVMFMPPKFKTSRFDMVNPARAPEPALPAVAADPGPGGPGGFTPNDIDAIVRTVYGEAARETPEGQRAVAEVIRNRATQGNMTPTDVVLAKGQFEPWATRRGELERLDPNSPVYKAILENIRPTIEGRAPDVTDQADHFYAPVAQAALGRKAPSWDEGDGTDIGNHRFFDKGYGGHPSSGVATVARGPTGGGVAGTRATAYADEGNNSSARTTAFDGLKPSQGVALAGQPQQATQADSEKGFGLGYLPKDVQMALIAAGLGMMAGKGSAGQQIGQGGLAGIQAYMAAQAARRKDAEDTRDRERKTLVEDRDYGLRERTLAEQAAERMRARKTEEQRLDFERRRVDLAEKTAKENAESGNFTTTPGEGTDAEGNRVPGTYVTDRKRGTMEFRPGVVTGAQKPNEEEKLTRKAEFEKLKEMDSAADAARGVRQSVTNLRELRKGVSYEGYPLAGGMATVAGAFGYGGGQALEAAATNFKLDLSGKLKGAISDKEQAMLNAATPGLGMSDDAANQTLATYEGVAERAIERAKFFQMWRARNKTLAGADDAWDRYVEANPVIKADKSGGLSLDRKNLGNWQSYIAAPGQAPRAGQPQGDVPVMQSPADAQKLAPGTRYRTPDGKEYTR